MGWIARKIDMVFAAVVATAGGMTTSQAPSFANAYLQRLGGRLDESVDSIALLYNQQQEEAARLLNDRMLRLQEDYEALQAASPLLRPLLVLRDGDWQTMGRVWRDFVPALSLDAAGLTYTLIGVFLALLAYELIKAPLSWVFAGGDEDEAFPAPKHRKGKDPHL